MRVAMIVLCVVVLAAVGMSAGMPADKGISNRAYVTNSKGDDVTVIDIATSKVIADIKVGDAVHGACAPLDGRRVFFTIESTHKLLIVDTTTNEITDTIALTGDPNQCASTPDGHYVAVPIRDIGELDMVDIPQKKIVKVLPLKVPHNCYSTASNDEFYCESRGDKTINRVDLKAMNYVHESPVDGDPRPFAISRDEKKMYVALTGFHGFAAINLAQNDALQRVDLPAGPPPPSPCEKFEKDTPTHGLQLSPNGKELWVTSLPDSGVYVYDVASGKFSKEIATGQCPNWIAFSPDGKYVAVSNSASDDTSIIDTNTRKEISRVKAGRVPKRLIVLAVPSAS